MVVEGRHTENALAVGQLKVGDLNDVAEGLGNIDDAHQNEGNRDVQSEGQSRHGAAQKQRAGIAHKDLGGMEVIDQKAAQTAEERCGKDAQLLIAPHHCHHGKEDGDRHCDAGGKAVYAVSQVDGIYRAHHDKGGKHHIEDPGQLNGHICKGDIDSGIQIAKVAQQHGEQDRRCQLQQELLRGSQALVLLVLHLHIVVKKADAAVDQGKQEHKQSAEFSLHQVREPRRHQSD